MYRRRLTAVLLAVLTLSPLTARATAEAPAIEIPNAVQSVINDARPLCEFPGGTFSFDADHLRSADLNKDGHPDYVLSAAGFSCTNNQDLYSTDKGYTHYIFLSSGRGTLRLDRRTSPVAYSFRIDERPSPPHLIFEQQCGGISTNRTQMRWGWSGTSMVHVSSTPPCPR